MLAIIKRELSLRRNVIIVFAAILLVLVILYTPLYPSIRANAAKFSQLINSMSSIYKDIGVEEPIAFNTFGHYLAAEMFGFTWPIIATVFVIGQAGASLAGEIENKNLGMLMSLPIKRLSMYTAKWITGLAVIAGLVILSVFSILPLASIIGISFNIENFLSLAILCFLFASTLFSLGFLVSSASSSKGHVYGLMGGIVLLMYIANIVAGLQHSLAWLKYISLFHYFNANAALGNHHIGLPAISIFAAMIILTGISGALVFKNRDVII